MDSQHRAASDSPLPGILLFCLGLAVLVGMSSTAKQLARSYPVTEIIFARYAFQCLLMLAMFPGRAATFLVSRRKGMQIVRGVLMLLSSVFMFLALGLLPLADISAISFTSPMIATILSVFVLGEHVGRRRWTAIAVGFLGMLIVVRPGSGSFGWPVLLPLGFAVSTAVYQTVTRLVREAADPLNALFYTALVGAVLSALMLPFGWRTPDTALDWAMLAGLGILGGLGHFLIILAYRRAPVSAIAPLGYSELIWAALAGYLFFGEVPDVWTWVGAAVIAGSGLYILQRERAVRR